MTNPEEHLDISWPPLALPPSPRPSPPRPNPVTSADVDIVCACVCVCVCARVLHVVLYHVISTSPIASESSTLMVGKNKKSYKDDDDGSFFNIHFNKYSNKAGFVGIMFIFDHLSWSELLPMSCVLNCLCAFSHNVSLSASLYVISLYA